MHEYETTIVYEVYFIFQPKNTDVFSHFHILTLCRPKCLMRYMITDMIEYGYRKSKGYCHASLILFSTNKRI